MRLLLSILMAFLLLPPASGQEWLALKNRASQQKDLKNYDEVVLLDSTSVNVGDNGSGTFTIRRVIQLQSPESLSKNRIIKYDYDPLTAFAEFKHVNIYKANGEIRPIDVKTTCDYAAPARAIYWGARQIMIEVAPLEEGDIIDYEIAKKGFTYALLANSDEDERFVPPMRGQFYDIVPFWSNEPIVKKVYRVAIPKEKEMQYEFYQGECASSVRIEGGQEVLTFTRNDMRPIKREANMVDYFDVAPKLMMSTTPDWKAKSLWFYKVNEDYGSFDATPEAQAKVDELIRGAKTDLEKISRLTHWVADNIRYSGISMGKGEGFTLHNTRMNFTDRCGVCKDKAALLISMLRMAGFEAYPAMTMAGSRVESIPADHFNHSVAVVKLSDGKYMPLDPTWVPFLRELWSSAEQQQNYLPGVPEGSDLQITPLSAPENHYFKIHANSTLDVNGTLSGEFIVEGEGQSDASIRRPFTTGFRSEWTNAMERELLRVSPQAKMIRVDYGKDPKNYVAAPIQITIKFVIPNYALAGEKTLIFKPLVFSNLYNSVRSYLRINTAKEERDYAFKDACSRLVVLDEIIRLPQGYTLSQPAMEEQKNSAVADFSGYLRQDKDQLQVHQELALKKRVYDAQDWPAFRDALNAHKAFADKPLIFEAK